MKYQGSCHCGELQFVVDTEKAIDKGLRCNCSICKRKGAVMSADVFSSDQLAICVEKGSVDIDELGLYQFDNRVAKHYFCKNCGIYPFHETFRMPGKFRLNLGCIDAIDIFSIDIDQYDGENLL